ncbi:MAG: diguanylate cyclase domain-containing protein [Acidimicrobiia bacterium]
MSPSEPPFSDAQYRLVVEHSRDAILVIDEHANATFASPACKEVLGYEPEELVGLSGVELIHAEDLGEVARRLGAAYDPSIPSGPPLRCRLRTATGEYRWFDLRSQFAAPDPLLGGIVVNVRDVHDQVIAERAVEEHKERLAHIALHDVLTGLSNRAAFIEQLEDLLRSRPGDARSALLLYVDVDHFKAINDAHGHAVGDALLIAVAARLRGSVRDSDLVARLGGDEFVVLCEGMSDEDARRVLERLTTAVPEPLVVNAARVNVTVSIGVARPRVGSSADDVIAAADRAMYEAKGAGRNQWVLDRASTA